MHDTRMTLSTLKFTGTYSYKETYDEIYIEIQQNSNVTKSTA